MADLLNGLHPHQFPELFAKLTLGDKKSPGTVTLSGHKRTFNWDVQAAKGSVGATSKLNGPPIGRFKATFYLAGDENEPDGSNDFTEWEDFHTLLLSLVPNGGTPKALPIYHPDLARNKFTEVSVAEIGEMVWDARGGASITVEFIEYKPPKPAAPKSATAKASAKKPDKPDPNAAAKQELAGLVDEAKKP